MEEQKEERRWVVSEEDGLTDIQRTILNLYWETFSITKACQLAGVDKSYVYHSLKRTDTEFTKAFNKMTQELETDPRITKVGGIANLIDIAERARQDGRYDIELKVQQELNKMIDKNLAIQKKTVENVNIEVKGVLDLTQDDDSHYIEADYQDVSYEEE